MAELKSPNKIGALERRKRQHQALQLHQEGRSFQEIADLLGVKRNTAYQYVVRALDELIMKDAEVIRSAELSRLYAMRSQIWAEAMGGSTSKMQLILEIDDRIFKISPGLIAKDGGSGNKPPQVVIFSMPDNNRARIAGPKIEVIDATKVTTITE
jgi:hypothetical protein